MKTQEIISKFASDAQKILGSSFVRAVLYGSYARGDFHDDSDIDIMILTTLTTDEIEKIENHLYDLAFDYLMDYGVDISVIIINNNQFQYWLGALPFYNNIDREGVVVNG